MNDTETPGVFQFAQALRDAQQRFGMASISGRMELDDGDTLTLTIFGDAHPLMAIENAAGHVQMIRPRFRP